MNHSLLENSNDRVCLINTNKTFTEHRIGRQEVRKDTNTEKWTLNTPAELSKQANQETVPSPKPGTLHKVWYSRPVHSFWTCYNFFESIHPILRVRSQLHPWSGNCCWWITDMNSQSRVKKCLLSQNCRLADPAYGRLQVQLSSSTLCCWAAVCCWFHHRLKERGPWNCKPPSNRLRSWAPELLMSSVHYLDTPATTSIQFTFNWWKCWTINPYISWISNFCLWSQIKRQNFSVKVSLFHYFHQIRVCVTFGVHL